VAVSVSGDLFMAHDIETMAFTHQPPWHGLGVPVEPDISTDDMLTKAGLDWSVTKMPLLAQTDPDNLIPVPSHYALTRSSDGTVLSVVGSSYEPVQNRAALDFFRDFVAAGDMTLETAGSLGGGKRIWALASLRDGFELPGGDAVQGYLLLTSPHLQNAALVAQFTPIRVVCANTLAMALAGDSAGLYRHHHSGLFSAERAKAALGLARTQLSAFHDASAFLASKRFDVSSVERFFVEVFEPGPASNDDLAALVRRPRVRRAIDALSVQPGAALRAAEGTWWGAVNAVTWLADHRLGRSADTRLSSAWFGDARLYKQRALSRALEYARAA
jgi:phage/plasmid-like protein (TIGR03299 family)